MPSSSVELEGCLPCRNLSDKEELIPLWSLGQAHSRGLPQNGAREDVRHTEAVFDTYECSFGQIYVVMDEIGVRGVSLTVEQWDDYVAGHGEMKRDATFCRNALQELDEYFSGKRFGFTVPLSIEGTEFCKKVWEELLSIPFGETRSYADVALAVGKPRGYRAIGQANRKNSIPIFIPCHRVIGKNGDLTGYCGTKHLDIKEYLLQMERVCIFSNEAKL
jgi:methylated-DNA-[protein]-cysteine S-methyltransferase